MGAFLNLLIAMIAALQFSGCIDSTPQISTSSNSNKLAATEIESKDKAIDKIRTLIEIIKISSLDAATKATLEAKLNAAITALENPDLDSSTLSKVLEDVKNLQTEVGTKTGTGGTSTSTPAPDTSAPPALTTFSGATGTASAAIDLTIVYPANVSDYDIVVIRRSTGASAPSDCSSGTSVKTYTSFANVVYTDATPSGGTAYSYRACIYDAAGNLTSSNTATNITSFTFTYSMFVTSATYTGNLGGVAGADAKCMAVASGAGLTGTWRAIISSRSVNAKDRIIIQGPVYDRNGVVIANNKADLWDGAIASTASVQESGGGSTMNSPWTGTLTAGSVYSAGASYYDCSDWGTASASDSGGGALWYTDGRWIVSGNYTCNTLLSLYCISQPSGFDLTAFSATTGSASNGDVAVSITFPATSTQFQTVDVRRITGAIAPNSDCASDGTVVKTFSAGGFTSQTFTDATGGAGVQYSYRACVYDTTGTLQSSSYTSKVVAKGTTHTIFLTSTSYTGNLGGYAGADAKCVTRAAAGGLANSANYKALLSDATVSLSTRITISGPVYTTNNDLIASNQGDMWDNTIGTYINYNEFSSYVAGGAYVWTGATGGSGAQDTVGNCQNWTSALSSDSGAFGRKDFYGSLQWINENNNYTCDHSIPLYCISQ